MVTGLIIIAIILIFAIGIRLDILCIRDEVHDRTVSQVKQLNKSFEWKLKMFKSIKKNIN